MMIAVYAIVTAAEYGWGSAHTLGFGAAAAVLLAAFVALEIADREPDPPPAHPARPHADRRQRRSRLPRHRHVRPWVLGSLYLEHVLGYGAWATGLAFLPMTLTVGALSLGTPRA